MDPLRRRQQQRRTKIYIERLLRAKSLVDHNAPTFPATMHSNVDKMLQDERTYRQRTKENARLLLNLSRTMRTMGDIGLQLHTSMHTPRIVQSTVPSMLQHASELERQNFILGRRLLGIKYRSSLSSSWDTRRQIQSQSASVSQSRLSRRVASSESLFMPNQDSEVFLKYAGWDLQLPIDFDQRLRLLRPRILLHFGSRDGRPLGEVIVQLYTEAAPLIVLQFVRTCLEHNSHEFSVRRIFPKLWLEIYLLAGYQSQAEGLSRAMEYDTRVLNHRRHAYILSCSKEYCTGGFPSAAINFTISFKPLSVLNGRRVGFGRVVRGGKVIACMQTRGTKNGKISRPLVITHCDLL